MEIATVENEFADVPFRPLWINIARLMMKEDLERLCRIVPEFQGIDRLVFAERKSDACKKDIVNERDYLNLKRELDPRCSLDVGEDELWYSWKACLPDFGSVKQFTTFCWMAGIQPDAVLMESQSFLGVNNELLYWVAEDKKVSLRCTSFDPRVNDRGYSLPASIEVRGLRCRSKCLLDWS